MKPGRQEHVLAVPAQTLDVLGQVAAPELRHFVPNRADRDHSVGPSLKPEIGLLTQAAPDAEHGDQLRPARRRPGR